MKGLQRALLAGLAVLLLAATSFALDVSIEPNSAQRAVGGTVRVHIYATDAVDLISFGIEVSFNPSVLQVIEANTNKNTDFNTGFVMDGDGVEGGAQHLDPAVEVNNTAGTVTMIGGRLIGDSTPGLSGRVLLGWITFDAIADGESDLLVDLAMYHPNDPTETFDNFVGLGGPPAPVYDSDIVPGEKGIICVVAGACTGDINANGAVDMGDFAVIRSAMGSAFPDARYNVAADLNANGAVDMGDFAVLRSQMGTSGCPSCPPLL